MIDICFYTCLVNVCKAAVSPQLFLFLSHDFWIGRVLQYGWESILSDRSFIYRLIEILLLGIFIHDSIIKS